MQTTDDFNGGLLQPVRTRSQATPGPVRQGSGSQHWRRTALSRLRGLERGRITLLEGDRSLSFGRKDAQWPLAATVEVRDPRFYRSLALGGSVGAAESFMRGEWSTDDLTALVRILILNRSHMNKLESGLSRLSDIFLKLYHRLRRNTPLGSRRNIAAHYDLGNDFYRLFLDESMMYSCAIFDRDESTLEEASFSKNERICRKLQLDERDHLLEIGTGWGGFAIHAASRFGCRVTTATISRAQRELALERIRRAGLNDRIEVVLEDYRNLTGRYRKLVSIEMIEAVGHQYFDTFFRRCSDLLEPNGMMLLQAITISDRFYERCKREVDFIKRYIFPGSCLPSVSRIGDSLARETDMKLFHLEDITPHYSKTLRAWRDRFLSRLDDVRRLRFSESFIRMWQFYLSYCEAGFAERHIGNVQILLTKPLCRRKPLIGE